MIKKLLYILIILLVTVPASAANFHCGVTGTGGEDGSDWENIIAFNDVTFVRDNIYYVTGGTYDAAAAGGWALSTAADGVKTIEIKKAVEAAHGSDTGWAALSSALKTGQTIFKNTTTNGSWGYQVFQISTPYWIINGVSRSSISSGHGIKVMYGGSGYKNLMFLGTDAADNCTFKYLEIEGLAGANDYAEYGINSDGASVNVQYCYIHDIQLFLKIDDDTADSWVIEYNYFKHNWSAVNHGSGITINGGDSATIRYNIFDDPGNGTSVIGVLGDYSNDQYSSDSIEIYGNVFFDDGSYDTAGNGFFSTSNATCSYSVSGWKIYNNTFYNTGSKKLINFPIRTCGGYEGEPASSIEFKNNLLFTATTTYDCDDITIDYNYFNDSTAQGTNTTESTQSLAQTFDDYSNDDFSLVSGSEAINAGMDASAILNEDIIGVSMPQNSVYDAGAYEYVPEIGLMGGTCSGCIEQ